MLAATAAERAERQRLLDLIHSTAAKADERIVRRSPRRPLSLGASLHGASLHGASQHGASLPGSLTPAPAPLS